MIRKIMDRLGTGWVFTLAMLFVYGATWYSNIAVFEKVVAGFWNILVNIIPVLVLVFGIMFFTNMILDAKKEKKYLSEESGRKGWLVAIAGGILSTGPIYMWYPLLSDLREKGVKDSLIAAFLYNRAVKIPLMPIMIYYFGWAFTILLAVYMVLFSIVNGIIVQRLVR